MDGKFDDILAAQAVPQDDGKAAFIAQSRMNRDKCFNLSKQMTEEVASDSGRFAQYLDMQSRFDRYTAYNVILIMAQKPDAQKIGDYGYWKSKGAFVDRAEYNNPILIMVPGKEHKKGDGTIGTYYNPKNVYDISQTSMKNRIQPTEERDDTLTIKALVSSPPVDIVPAEADRMPDDRGAVFEPEEGCIYVRKGMDAEQIFQSLVPELALAGFAEGRTDYDKDGDMFHAYCVSYMLSRKYGFDTQGYDFSHAPEMFEGMEPQEVREELSRMRDSANRIISRMEKVFAQYRPQQAQEQNENRTPGEEAGKGAGQEENRTRQAHGWSTPNSNPAQGERETVR